MLNVVFNSSTFLSPFFNQRYIYILTVFFPPLIVLISSFPPFISPPFLYTSNFLGSASMLPLHTHLRVLPLQSKRDDQIMKPSGLWYAAVNSGLLKALHRGIAWCIWQAEMGLPISQISRYVFFSEIGWMLYINKPFEHIKHGHRAWTTI